jgi:tRNA-splicing ligase RtcB
VFELRLLLRPIQDGLVVMPFTTIAGRNVPIRIWAPIDEVNEAVMAQLKKVAALPWVAHHVAVMPDVHLGIGATVGSVIAMRDAVAPAAVGVDIGCGMAALATSLTAKDLPDNLHRLRTAIEAAIPVGFEAHEHVAWQEDGAPDDLRAAGKALMAGYEQLALQPQGMASKVAQQLGTLGGGNHFIEVCLDTTDRVWLMLHSGSRHIGNVLAQHHIQIARRLQHNRVLEDPDLAVFLAGTPAFADYRRDLTWAQDYARFNRQLMLHLLTAVVRRFWPQVRWQEAISCHHNYVAEEVHFGESLLVTRKGAIRAGRGELGIIPGSMGTRSFIVRGLGNEDAFASASHGAGRRMSRSQARKRFTVADLRAQTEGIECRKDPGVLDEVPGAYKAIDQVMAQQRDLVEIVAELRQIVCVKG